MPILLAWHGCTCKMGMLCVVHKFRKNLTRSKDVSVSYILLNGVIAGSSVPKKNMVSKLRQSALAGTKRGSILLHFLPYLDRLLRMFPDVD